MRALIIEDEPAAAENLRFLLRQVAPDWQIVDVLDTVAAATVWLSIEPPPDVIFSDIHLADGNAFTIYERREVSCPIVFVTAFDAYALRAFRHNGIDYLLKPIGADELARAVERVKAMNAPAPSTAELARLMEAMQPRSYRTAFLLPFRDQLIPVRTEEIAYFYTEQDVVFARLRDGERRYVVDETLERLEQQLDPAVFFRANRQLIVQREAVRGLKSHINGRYLLRLRPEFDRQIAVSKARMPELRGWLGG
jgi:two-component system LytT family response regulator